jgi:hypothetical protein
VTLSDSSTSRFLRFCAGDDGPRTFEDWVYAAPDLEAEIGPGPHLDLIAADYRGRDVSSARDLCGRLLEERHPGLLARYRVATILESTLADDGALLSGLRRLIALRHDEAHTDLIPIEFVAFDSETDGMPTPDRYHLWESSLLAAKLAAAKPYLAMIRRASEALLADLRKQLPDFAR